jgi:2-keto-3-deoxy-L-rhamnonate aldolase RhmA
MRENKIKRLLKDGKAVCGSYIQSPDAYTAEMMAMAGFDFILVDTEHSPIDVPQLNIVMIALRGSESSVVVRAIWNDPVNIKRILDLGPEGIIVPWVNSAEECRRAVAACKYQPEGVRGFGPRRAFRINAGGNLKEYAAEANKQIAVFVQIETPQAVAALDEILTTPGLDGIMIGPADLSMSHGLLPDLDAPALDAIIDKVLAKCKQHKVPFGMFTHTVERAKKWAARGAQIVTAGGDLDWIAEGIARVKKALPEIIPGHK